MKIAYLIRDAFFYFLPLILLIAGFLTIKYHIVNSYPYKKQDLMVHEYVIEWAQKLCEQHDGLHYIVPIATPVTKGSYAPMCEDLYRVRCQDQYMIEFNTGASICDSVASDQYSETMAQDPNWFYHL